MKRLARWTWRLFVVCSIIAAIGMAVHRWALPPIAESIVAGMLDDAGIDARSLTFTDVGLGMSRAHDVSLGADDALHVDWIEATYSIGSLRAGRIHNVTVSGLTWRIRVVEGQLVLAPFDQLTSSGESASGLPFDEVTLRDCTLEVVYGNATVRLPLAGRLLRKGDDQLDVKLQLNLGHLPFELAGVVRMSPGEDEMVALTLSPAGHWAAIDVGGMSLDRVEATATYRRSTGAAIHASASAGTRRIAIDLMHEQADRDTSAGDRAVADAAADSDLAAVHARVTVTLDADDWQRMSSEQVRLAGPTMLAADVRATSRDVGGVTVWSGVTLDVDWSGVKVTLPDADLQATGLAAHVYLPNESAVDTSQVDRSAAGSYVQINEIRGRLPDHVATLRVDVTAAANIAGNRAAGESPDDGGSSSDTDSRGGDLWELAASWRPNDAVLALIRNQYDVALEGGWRVDVAAGGGLTPTFANASVTMDQLQVRSETYDAEITSLVGRVEVDLLDRLRSPGNQMLTIGEARIGPYVFEDGRMALTVESLSSLLIERMQVQWSQGGVLRTHAIRVNPANPAFDAELFFEDVNLQSVLALFRYEQVRGDGVLYGRLPLRFDGGAAQPLSFSPGYLYTPPGDTRLQFADQQVLDLILSQMDSTMDDLVKRRLVEALRDFRAQVVRMDLRQRASDGAAVAVIRLAGKGVEGAKQEADLTFNVANWDQALNEAIIIKRGSDRALDHSLNRFFGGP